MDGMMAGGRRSLVCLRATRYSCQSLQFICLDWNRSDQFPFPIKGHNKIQTSSDLKLKIEYIITSDIHLITFASKFQIGLVDKIF
jgi:hypothetical protein